MKQALITGANKGIGLETARQLLRKDIFVFLGSRNPENGLRAVKKLQSEGLTHVAAIQLDVTDDASVKAARKAIGARTGTLDILVNNAGINGGSTPYTALGATPAEFASAFNTNVIGVARVTGAFIDLLRNSPEPRIVNVSTSVGSLSLQNDPAWPAYDYAKYAVYSVSKAALNMYTINLAYELRGSRFKVNAVCPGYTATDFTSGHGGAVQVAAGRISRYALIGQDGPTGKFFSEETNPATAEIPW